MDRLEGLGNQLSQITMYDIKSMYNQAKNMVLNVTEMEAKVREATNDDPWGASSTLMQEIAQGTFNFQHFNEIMPAIYSRFMDKEARQWREIYKALQLLEYIIKHGSERVVDDARSHLSTIKMLRNFHYIDEKGKDQGINVRNRAKELSELLVDVEKIRGERRKAKSNRNKYVGTGNDGMSFSSGGGRYGGFGNEGYGGGGSYSGGGGGGGYDNGGSSSGGGFRDEAAGRRGYEEYDAGDYDTSARRSNNGQSGTPGRSGSLSTRAATAQATSPPPKAAPKQAVKEVDLLGFGDDDASATSGAEKALPVLTASNPLDGDDEFDDFQAAPPSAPANKPNVFEFLNSTASQPAVAAPPRQAMTSMQPQFNPVQQPATFNAFPAMSPTANRQTFAQQAQQPPIYSAAQVITPTSPPARQSQFANTTLGGGKGVVSATATTTAGKAAVPASSVNFDDLFSMSLGSASASANKGATGNAKSIKDLEKEKSQAGIWGSAAQSKPAAAGSAAGFGSFGVSGASTNASGDDDLLL
ncbi:ENTH-domain-containing protein [Rickenella mellea]|uniref:ENTH-domain-containing protein n=1 Tax=Rickenella mellea TaxID=50990 RepID=A0A4Y7PX47_9AGAM|nr:ENTH-domain-containing protein [Rickenella mellea]